MVAMTDSNKGNDVIFMSEEDVERAVLNILADYSAEHLRWGGVTGQENLDEKLARFTLEALGPSMLSAVTEKAAREHVCSDDCNAS